MINRVERAKGKGILEGLGRYFKTQAIPLIVLSVMIIVASILSPVFLTKINLQNLVIQQSLTMVVSIGMFVVILTGGIDLSVGSIVAVAGVFCASFMQMMTWPLALLATLCITILIGAFNGLIVAKLKIAPFIVSLGMLSFASGIAYWYSKSSPISWSGSTGAAVMKQIGIGKMGSVPVLAIIWIVFVLLASFMMNKTTVGRVMYAIGGNEEAVNLSGIDVSRWKIFPYAFSGLCCGIGGILLMARLGIGAPTSGNGLELDCIAGVVIGGTSFSGGKGSISGVVIGVFILGIINNILDLMNVSAYPQLMLKGAIIVFAVILSTVRDKNA
ncbi:MAG: ABC transporter permease [Clostridia bacterium]